MFGFQEISVFFHEFFYLFHWNISQKIFSSCVNHCYLIFNTIPDRWIFAGSTLIVISGIYTAHRERVRAKLDRLNT